MNAPPPRPGAPGMRVALATVAQRVHIWLRFGAPQRIMRLDDWRRLAVFPPGEVCCRVSWVANDHGTIAWRLMVMQAATSVDGIQRMAGVTPGARVLLRADGERNVKTMFGLIATIEATGIAPVHVSPAYWRTVHNRLAARLVPPAYTAERHAAYLARRALVEDRHA